MKFCPICKEIKEFSINRKRKDVLQCYCKDCSNEMNKFYHDKKKPTLKKVCQCGTTFETKSTIKAFCTKECKVKYFNKLNNSNANYKFKYEFKRKFEARNEPKPNNFKKWTGYEDLLIFEFRKNKIKWKEIALQFGRSTDSCKTRFRDLKKKDEKINNK